MTLPPSLDSTLVADPQAGSQAAASDGATAENARLLLVDDDAAVLALLCRQLCDYGFTLETATSGAGCLAQLEERPPDLILLDINMPAPDGFSVLIRLREHPTARAVPVILLTGRQDAESKVRGFELGAVDYVTKPVTESELHARVTSHLARARLTQALLHRLTAYEARFAALGGPPAEGPPDPEAQATTGGGGIATRFGGHGLPEDEVGRFLAARELLESRLSDPPAVAELAARFGMNQRQFARGFRALFGLTVHAWLLEAKTRRACELLSTTGMRVKTIAYEVGYRQTSDLTRAMVARVGMTPTAWRARARGAQSDPECRD
jgi:CheY-like chemotaxis protein/AraC-like DNA-binding protein